MVETVLSMARSMLGGAISVAASAAAAEMGLLVGVRKDICFIKDELETMQAFLVVAESTKKKDMLLKVWANQVRDLSYNIEDCLGEFMVHVGSQSLSHQLMKLKDRHRIAMQIRDVKSRVEEVSIRNTRYNLMKTDAPNTIDEVDSYMEDVRNNSASNIDEAELVGFVRAKEELIKMVDVNSNNGTAKVICVVGMGGLGKTTLVRKVYESKEDVAKKFSCHAWITVSQTALKIEMLKDMIKQLLGGESLKKCLSELEGKSTQVKDLAQYLTEGLKDKRYFIVIDDLWTIDAWRWIKDIGFPYNNYKGSRIILTTRGIGLAKECTLEALIYYLKPLEPLHATNLLLRKSRKSQEDMQKDDRLKDIVGQLVKKCGCLPLAILTIGSVLATKKMADWGQVCEQLPSELESNPSLDAMRRMVTLSYNHLPSHLKSCFLYLSIFPEDYEIQRKRLVDRWIAEGFVRARVGMTIEAVGNIYFDELVSRSMIEPSKLDTEGNVQSCRVHDIMRDAMVSISSEENFVFLVRDNVTGLSGENFRHIAYHGSKCQKLGMDWGRVRSLTMFGERPTGPSPSLCSPSLRMLRAMDLLDAQFKVTQEDINNIGLMCHLKYVSVRCAPGYSNIYKLPRSIGNLQGLQTLDIENTCIATLPIEISKLQNLRSLRCSRQDYYIFFNPHFPKKCLMHTLRLPMIYTPLVNPNVRAKVIAELHMAYSSSWSKSVGVAVPRGISKLEALQILEVVDIKQTSSRAIAEMGELIQLRELSVVTKEASKRKCKILCATIEKLSSLCSLYVDAEWDGSLEWLHCVRSPPLLLRTLKLVGRLGEELPNWVGNLMHLVNIYLENNQLKKGVKSVEMLGVLPNLMFLGLHWHAYAGEKLAFREGAFPNLKKLDIIGLDKLREVRFEEGTSPRLEMIEIIWCSLVTGLIGVEHLPSIKEISLGYNGKVAKLGVLQRKLNAHRNHPVLQLDKNWSDHILGDAVQGSSAVQLEGVEEDSALLSNQVGECSSQVVISTNKSGDSESSVEDDGDDFCSCISDEEDSG